MRTQSCEQLRSHKLRFGSLPRLTHTQTLSRNQSADYSKRAISELYLAPETKRRVQDKLQPWKRSSKALTSGKVQQNTLLQILDSTFTSICDKILVVKEERKLCKVSTISGQLNKVSKSSKRVVKEGRLRDRQGQK